ncbi:MAG: ABC transporter substrate-binding protein [Alphaproteobacteria bacterium]|nr:ABC transporter substrate-binding protein [Alphaproteobacteria bacterium]
MITRSALLTTAIAAAIAALTAAPVAAESPKRGGTLTYMIPADAPPSFDGHRETTFATAHAVSPFYSVLIRVNPNNPASPTDFVCDLCTEMPKPTDGGKLYTFKIRQGVKFHDGSPLTSADVVASWQKIISPKPGVTSARASYFNMVESVTAPDATTVVFKLKTPSPAFVPALADPFAYIYKKEILDKDPHWFEKNVMGSGPFKLTSYDVGQSIKGERFADYHHKGQPYLDGIVGIFAAKESVRVAALRADRAAAEFRGHPPSARDELVKELGDKVTVQQSNWNCVLLITPNQKKKPFDDVRVRRALALAIDNWNGAPALSKIAIVNTVGGVVFPGSPLAATKEELQKLVGYWPDINKSRAEAKKLLQEAGVPNYKFELMNRNVDQPYKFVATWLIDEWSKAGMQVTQRVLPTGPFYDGLRNGTFDVSLDFNCQSVVNPLLDVGKFLPRSVYAENYGGYEDKKVIDLYNAMQTETDPAKLRQKMRDFETYVLDTQVHMIMTPWWNRILALRSYMKGWKISPSHYQNQDLANVWLDK